MTHSEVFAMAMALAKANGHPEPDVWAEKVVTNWEQLDAAPASTVEAHDGE
jgi:hypothetical protein